ncbi:MAG: hypothetical protein GTO45_10360 [Candidatus Aminicenantes bacterium]|nr:hypothetical protein [Candidatus Aminicenantes bacterium]NIM79212.1 hypothetical protein [Candidatus Aminicenantes bacterium]NIN18490.1 hypothetical protein [Candidatus Aminicenantes bacterium]NIN42386.1 hypothetical protein [Candidatus Aminicenantes bacterium]NIN85152.1 hypothetical protein [Candidatus Aminicenantes bacterium]
MRQEKEFRHVKAEKVLYNDVCSTCNHVKICTSRKNRQGPVWFCEEFDDYVAVMEKKSVGSEFQIIPPWKGSNPIESSIEFKGLCINCENRKTCVNSRVEGGIWHCEEYC